MRKILDDTIRVKHLIRCNCKKSFISFERYLIHKDSFPNHTKITHNVCITTPTLDYIKEIR